jgi:hypothetical protein
MTALAGTYSGSGQGRPNGDHHTTSAPVTSQPVTKQVIHVPDIAALSNHRRTARDLAVADER